MKINISLQLTLPDDTLALDVVYFLGQVRLLAKKVWPGADLRARPVEIPCKSSSSRPMKQASGPGQVH